MKVTLLAVVTLTAVASIVGAADPECIYRKLRGLSPHWPNPSSCSSYYRCSNKKVVRSISCPTGKQYNQKTGKCSAARRGLCRLSLAAPLADSNNVCASEVNGAYLPKAGYCAEFYICDEQLAYTQSCDAGSYFDIKTNGCIPDPTAECWQNECLTEKDGVIRPRKSSCASYVVCQDKRATLNTCASGSYFNSSSLDCVVDEGNSNCWENFCIGKPDGSMVGDPDDCVAFYICSNQKATAQVCPTGSYFDETGLSCIPGTCPDKGATSTTPAPGTECSDDQIEADKDACNQYKKCVNGAWQTVICPSGTFFDKTLLVCVVDVNNECPQCSGSTTPAPGTECSDDQIEADKDACNQYKKCVNGAWQTVICPSGTFFDKTLLVCVVDVNNECPQCSGSTTPAPGTECSDDQIEADKDACNQYKKCVNGAWETVICPSGTFFDKTLLACVVDDDNECPQCGAPPSGKDCADGTKNGDRVVDPQNCRQYFTCQDGELVVGDCLEGNYFDTKSNQCAPDTNNICTEQAPSKCENGTTSVDKENCNQYNVCVNGCWQSRTCPSGSYFDEDLLACTVDVKNVCPQAASDTDAVAKPPAAGGKCQDLDAAVPVDNCWNYLACINGVWMEESCNGGFYFDGDVGICRRDDKNQCPENKLIKPNSRSRRSAGACSNGMADGTMAASTTECDKYVVCQDGQLSEGTCGRGNIFSSTLGACVPDTAASCWICSNKPNGFLMADASNCSSYYTCNDGLAVPQGCAAGERFDGDSCIIDVTGQCINPCSCGSVGDVAHPICSKYFQCNAGVPTVLDCPKGEAFDAKTGLCSATVACNALNCATASDGDAFPVADDTSRFYLCYNKIPLIRACPANAVFDPTLSICLVQPSASCDQKQCSKSTLNQVYPANTCDKSTFCQCESDGAYLKKCEPGTKFDPELALCTFTGPCNPMTCLGTAEYTPSVNYDDPDSFCLCRAEQPVSVPCPIGYTFDNVTLECVAKKFPDPRCCSGYCAGKGDGVTFPAKDTETGFCLCMNEQVSFNSCPIGKIYDQTYDICLYPDANVECPITGCDSGVCASQPEYLPYPSNTTDGFCYCKDSCAIYAQCRVNTEFDPELLICLESSGPAICDPTKCDTLENNVPYAASNGTQGFCYCQDGLPNYGKCPEGKEFDPTFEICMEAEVASPFCDSEKCESLSEGSTFPSSKCGDDRAFCACLNGAAVYKTCPIGRFYNESAGRCDIREAPCSVCDSKGCAKLPNNSNFAALNSTTGFCLCVQGVPVYEECPEGKKYDTTYDICLAPAKASVNLQRTCDSTRCSNRAGMATFAAADTESGFCTCDANGVAIYQSCGESHIFDRTLGVCVINVCDPALCKTRSKFEAFAARNTSRGFCACDTVPTYYHCSAEHVFDADLGICVHEVTADVAVCDPIECSRRSGLETFAAKNRPEGFCLCDGSQNMATYHACGTGKLFDRVLGVCVASEHGVQKRSVEPQEKFVCEANAKRSVPANCSQYEVCLDGNWRRRSCNEERYYNPEQQRCLEPRDDMVCHYARVPGLPSCDAASELETMPSRPGKGSCQQYFRCAAGKWRLRSCPRRHYYAPSLSTCLAMPELDENDFCSWLNRSQSQPAAACQHLTVRPYATSCDKFLMCLESVWWIQQCPLGMYFSRESNYCLPSDGTQCRLEAHNSTTCETGQQRAMATSCRLYEECLNGRWQVKACAQMEQFESQLGCVPNDGSCQGSGMRRSCRQGELRPLALPEANCSQFFYYCDADEWHLSSCLRGNSFVPKLNKCQSSYKCQAQLKTLPTSSCSGQPDGRSVADAGDCTRFYLCLQQQPALHQSCAAGSFYDSALGYCRPNDGSCQPIDAVCSNRTLGSLVAHADNCQAYYNCTGPDGGATPTLAQLLHCPAGHYFDVRKSQCLRDQGQCQRQQALASQGLCQRLAHGTRLPHPVYCNQYYACVHGLAILAECEARWRFNATLARCAPESSAAEALQPACQRGQLAAAGNGSASASASAAFSCEHLQDGSYVPDASDCTRYYICVGGVPLMQRCGSGAYFDGERLLCTEDDGSCPYVIDGVAANATDGNANGNATNAAYKPPNPVLCEGKHGYLLPDLANCNNFYICVSNKLRGERCYAGYFFNATLQQCQPFEQAANEEQDVEPGDADLAETQPQSQSQSQSQSQPQPQPQPPRNCTDAPTDFASLCEVIGEGASIAEPGDCRRYISCDEDEPISQRCRNGESYDSLLGICRQNDGTCLMENGERVGVCSGKHGQLARDAQNCRGYFVCLHGQKIEAECEAGHFFSKASNACEPDVLQQCSSKAADLPKPKAEE